VGREGSRYIVEIFGIIGEMNADKGGPPMAPDHSISGCQQRISTGVTGVGEGPLWMYREFIVSLVLGSYGFEEGFRIAGMNEDRQTEFARFAPNGIEQWVIDGKVAVEVVGPGHA
jgi:hypothetical protein